MSVRSEAQATYLGITIGKDLYFYKHMKTSSCLIKTWLNNFRVPSATYGEDIWYSGSPETQKTVKDTQMILVRRCGVAPWFIRNEDLRRELKLQYPITRAKTRREQAIGRMRSYQVEGIRKREEVCEATPD
ncbi:hypothetical protein Trydic_g1328 [Trypoxylus dichotomus]